ncbi:hypothetical protein T484DRAFT_2695234 [Baffinella frigidus]|nr:hypothetical protein T484DRAFT_2695234 [Cryptophyta sp. CCMP2293]
MSPGAPPLSARPFQRTRSLPTTFINQTPSTERAQPPRRKHRNSTEEAVHQRMSAVGLALVDHFEASGLGSSFQLTVTAETNGPLGHSEKEHYARMMSSFAVEDSEKRSAASSSSLSAVQRLWGLPPSRRRLTVHRSWSNSAPHRRTAAGQPNTSPPSSPSLRSGRGQPRAAAGQLPWGRAFNLARSVSMKAATSPADVKVESSLVFAAAETGRLRHSIDYYRSDRPQGGGRSSTFTRGPTR